MYGFEGLGLSEVQLSISELSVVGVVVVVVVDFGSWVLTIKLLGWGRWMVQLEGEDLVV